MNITLALVGQNVERLTSAIEGIANELNQQDQIVAAQVRIEQLESVLKNFLQLWAKPTTKDEEWDAFVGRVEETIP